MTVADDLDFVLPTHQYALMVAPTAYPEIEYFFLVAGYGSGKSFAGVWVILSLAFKYQGEQVVIGIGGGTITMLRKTLLNELFRVCILYGITYHDNRQDGMIRIGSVLFVIIATENPDRIYAYNFSAFICDEIDELPQPKSLATFRAIQERVRITFPDGRKPFSVFMTTSQGYRGIYTIINMLQEKRISYFLVRGKTRDNPSLPKAYVDRLYALYNDVERRVFLEGEFANLTTGRVYYEYDEADCLLTSAPFKVERGDVVHIGQDLNAGFSRGSAYVKRGKILYVVKVWSFREIGRAPAAIRVTFPDSRILWYPDASGAEIIKGYADEMRAAGIELRMGKSNPPVLDRILIMNKLAANHRLKLFPEAAPLSTALKVRQYNDAGDPEKGKGPDAPDHYCDGAEYGAWRIVMEDSDFADLRLAARRGYGVLT